MFLLKKAFFHGKCFVLFRKKIGFTVDFWTIARLGVRSDVNSTAKDCFEFCQKRKANRLLMWHSRKLFVAFQSVVAIFGRQSLAFFQLKNNGFHQLFVFFIQFFEIALKRMRILRFVFNHFFCLPMRKHFFGRMKNRVILQIFFHILQLFGKCLGQMQLRQIVFFLKAQICPVFCANSAKAWMNCSSTFSMVKVGIFSLFVKKNWPKTANTPQNASGVGAKKRTTCAKIGWPFFTIIFWNAKRQQQQKTRHKAGFLGYTVKCIETRARATTGHHPRSWWGGICLALWRGKTTRRLHWSAPRWWCRLE